MEFFLILELLKNYYKTCLLIITFYYQCLININLILLLMILILNNDMKEINQLSTLDLFLNNTNNKLSINSMLFN